MGTLILLTRLLTILAASFLFAASAMAATSISAPLGGYCRIGQFMPLEVSIDQPAEVGGQGLLPIRIDGAAGGAGVIVPVLVLDTPGDELSVAGRLMPLPMHVLASNERLVGLIGPASAPAIARLFPGLATIPARLDPADPLPGSPLCWESLDAVVCDGPLPQRVDGRAIASLLGSGVTFAVRSPAAPDSMFPWRSDQGWWVLRAQPAGPDSAISPEAYAPITANLLGAGPRQRGLVVAIGVIVAIVILGATLMARRRWAQALAATAVSVAAAVGIAAWAARQPAVRQQTGAVVVVSDALIQSDQWTWQIATRPTTVSLPLIDSQHPMLASPEQAKRLDLVLHCGSDGQPERFSATLPTNGQLAFLRRTVTPGVELLKPDPALNSPMQLLTRAAYLGPGISPLGQIQPTPPAWPAVVLRIRRSEEN